MNSSPTTNTPCSISLERPSGPRERITAQIAARRCSVSVWTIYRLLQSGHLEGERPSPRKTFVFADSLEAHRQATHDPDFWENRPCGSHHRLAS